jgi:hypothetical protein
MHSPDEFEPVKLVVKPTGQDIQLDNPVAGAKDPRGHKAQRDEPGFWAKVPIGHFWQVEEEFAAIAVENVPGGQPMQSLAFVRFE